MDIISCQRYISDVASVAHIFLCILLNIGVCYVLDTLLGRVEAYFMRCNCHDKDFCERNGLEQQRKDCPEKGCVAPDLAVMDIDTFGNELADASFTALEEYLDGVGAADRADCLEWWAIGRDFILVEIRLRLHPYGCLPTKLACIGYRDKTTMRIHLALWAMHQNMIPKGSTFNTNALK
jgi:hypothetical protein